MTKSILFLAIASVLLALCQGEAWSDLEETSDFWTQVNAEELQDALNKETLNTNKAKNVIMFLGDGMGIPTITAGRILKGQMQGQSGEELESAMDSFSHMGFSKTYCLDRDGTDSASAATAYLTGVKGNYHTIGVAGAVKEKDCGSYANGAHNVDSILIDSAKAGKATGIVTTTRVIHASPAGAFGHVPYRSMYADDDVPSSCQRLGLKDLAQQFYDQSEYITVALGGGREYFKPEGTYDVEYGRQVQNNREDGQDLVKMWQAKYGADAKYVWNQAQFDAVDPATTEKLWGMFEPGDLAFEVQRQDPNVEKAGEPSLKEMTEKAIQILQKDPDGYFLFVEGGRIDHGHHGSEAYSSLHDWVAFDEAIQTALDMTSEDDTLIVVTADHSHTFMFGGDAQRGNPIFGYANSDALDHKPYSTLVYGNGEGFQKGGEGYDSQFQFIAPQSRSDLTTTDLAQSGMHQQSAAPIGSEDHGAEDVAIFARGPMSHLFHTSHEQTYIPYVMRYASCVGSDLRHCDGDATARQASPEAYHQHHHHRFFQNTTTSDYPVTPDLPAATFLGMDLDTNQTQIGLYVQFILCICLFFCCMNSIVVTLKFGGRRRGQVEAKFDDSYRQFDNRKL